jgi:hypothetical protein
MKFLFLLLVLAGPEKGPRVVVTSAHRVGHAPASFRPIARVHDPNRELQCPSFEWSWGDGCVSRNEPDCDPYEDTDSRRTLWVLQPLRYHVYRVPGEYVIAMTVVAGDRTLRDTVTVIVSGSSLK